ncbi:MULTISPECIES: hypothetical protein [unclassified Lactobacillus]|uniref:hypothetical protein n=1 Tax=unclassified Lactobacillus TaxID=2620435 RepID=UPI0005135543|nr:MULTISPECIES: hypothetical protein [unclassified Lactobacillus]KGG55160.1 hypothetical protein LACWKB10_0243 [Lactobacillus sp. wkB10]MBI0033771.1 hypothetical protein [Lactobacillus sp. M0396]
MAESMIGLMIATVGVITLALTVRESRIIERKVEQKTDRTYAWSVLKKHGLKRILIHDHIYELNGNNSIYDMAEKKTYKIKN